MRSRLSPSLQARSAQLFSFAFGRRSSAVMALPHSFGQGISVAKGQRLPALSGRVGGAASPMGWRLTSSLSTSHPAKAACARAGASGAISPAYLAALPANIAVKVATAFGLRWTSRKRAALYLQR